MSQKISDKIKICITSTGSDLSSPIDPRFGRCAYFLIVSDKGKLIKAVPNTGAQSMRGAGVSAAQIVADEKVETVITGNVGPNAYTILKSLGMKIFHGASNMTVEQALQAYKKKEFEEVNPSQGTGFGPGFGRGTGAGMGAGRGFGRKAR